MLRRPLRLLAPLLLVLTALVPLGLGAGPAAPVADAAEYERADHSEHYIQASTGPYRLHADVLRPKGIGDAKTPVILTVSPYTNHSGEPLEGGHTEEGYSSRFFDFLDLTDALDRGYTYVMVDLPGFGGSGGCNDWGGAREQGAVSDAVEWAASQPWSTGKVGLIGKSYDAWTGLMGVTNRPKGLAAVVSMEPVFAGYNYLYNNGVRFSNAIGTPALFQVIDATPGTVYDDPAYHLNGLPLAYCYGVNVASQQQDQADAPFWARRNLLPRSRASRVPLFLTQGFLETNTKPDAAFDFYNHLAGTGTGPRAANRAWFGQFDHVRGWELDAEGRPQTGRPVAAFVRQVRAFLDLHLQGRGTPGLDEPRVEVQDQLGRWRREAAWPPADVRALTTSLNDGSYADDGANDAFGEAAGQGIWTVSAPLRQRAWLAGEPQLRVRTTTSAPRANLVGLVYDIDPDGTARLISRGALLLRDTGTRARRLDLYGQDWVLQAGHRIGVLVTGADASWWDHLPTRSTVTVDEASIRLPFLTRDRTRFLAGGSSPRLEEHLAQTADVDAATLRTAGRSFTLPPRLR